MQLLPGSIVGPYRVIRKLGEGGMGLVLLAVHAELGQTVVLKVLHEHLVSQPELRARFVREAEALARLNHPNIVRIYNLLELPEGAVIVMEYADGQTFDDLLQRTGLIPPARAIELLIPVLSAMRYAHAMGVVHRDLKPANLMLLESGQVRVLDFGTAKLADRPGLTRLGMTLGTATFMAPEQLRGSDVGPGADIYALGVTLYEMCTGHLPFEAEEGHALVRKVLLEPPTPPRLYAPNLPESLEGVILRCLAKRPEDRYASAADLEADLRGVLATGVPSGAMPPERPSAAALATPPRASTGAAPWPPHPPAPAHPGGPAHGEGARPTVGDGGAGAGGVPDGARPSGAPGLADRLAAGSGGPALELGLAGGGLFAIAGGYALAVGGAPLAGSLIGAAGAAAWMVATVRLAAAGLRAALAAEAAAARAAVPAAAPSEPAASPGQGPVGAALRRSELTAWHRGGSAAPGGAVLPPPAGPYRAQPWRHVRLDPSAAPYGQAAPLPSPLPAPVPTRIATPEERQAAQRL